MHANAQKGINNARKQSNTGPRFGANQCLLRVRQAYGAPAIGDFDGDRSADAEDGWKAAKRKHPTSNPNEIPAGVPIWWTGGSNDNGHVAISLGNGRCISTDIRRTGWFDECDVDQIRRRWGLQLVGWSEDINGVTVYTPPPRKAPKKQPKLTRIQTAHNALAVAHYNLRGIQLDAQNKGLRGYAALAASARVPVLAARAITRRMGGKP